MTLWSGGREGKGREGGWDKVSWPAGRTAAEASISAEKKRTGKRSDMQTWHGRR